MSPYKMWVTRTIPLVFLLGALITLVPLHLLNTNYQENGLEGKEYLLRKDPRIIFGGDSRAERQLNPQIAAQLLNTDEDDVVNIAVTAGDPLMIGSLVDKYPETFRDVTLIVSVSANQINDGAKGRKYFSTAMISKLNVFEQIYVLLPFNFRTWKDYYRTALYQSLGIARNENRNDFKGTNGFYPVNGIMDISAVTLNADTVDTTSDNIRHPWYVDYNSNGKKYSILKESLKYLLPKVGKLAVFTGPFAPGYLISIHNSPLYHYEMDFEAKLAAMCKELDISFASFLENPLLLDEHFVNSAHLNSVGADIFTEIVIREFVLSDS